MGYFSWNCEECGHPMLCIHATENKNKWMNDVVAIVKNGSVYKGQYGGCGTIFCSYDVEDGYVDISGREPTCYHEHCWENAGEPVEYKGESDWDPDQGWFFEDGVHNIDPPVKKEQESNVDKEDLDSKLFEIECDLGDIEEKVLSRRIPRLSQDLLKVIDKVKALKKDYKLEEE